MNHLSLNLGMKKKKGTECPALGHHSLFHLRKVQVLNSWSTRCNFTLREENYKVVFTENHKQTLALNAPSWEEPSSKAPSQPCSSSCLQGMEGRKSCFQQRGGRRKAAAAPVSVLQAPSKGTAKNLEFLRCFQNKHVSSGLALGSSQIAEPWRNAEKGREKPCPEVAGCSFWISELLLTQSFRNWRETLSCAERKEGNTIPGESHELAASLGKINTTGMSQQLPEHIYKIDSYLSNICAFEIELVGWMEHPNPTSSAWSHTHLSFLSLENHLTFQWFA